MVKKFVDSKKTNWDKHLDLLLAAYRATPHPATGYSPNMLIFGREINIRSDILFPVPRPEDIRDRLEDIYHTVWKNLKTAAEQQKSDYDSRIVENVYQKGDIVSKREGAGKKLGPKYAGPFIVIEYLCPSVYKIQGKRVTLVP